MCIGICKSVRRWPQCPLCSYATVLRHPRFLGWYWKTWVGKLGQRVLYLVSHPPRIVVLGGISLGICTPCQLYLDEVP